MEQYFLCYSKKTQCVNDCFSIFTVEPLRLLHLGISKKLKESTVFYLSVVDRAILFFSN